MLDIEYKYDEELELINDIYMESKTVIEDYHLSKPDELVYWRNRIRTFQNEAENEKYDIQNDIDQAERDHINGKTEREPMLNHALEKMNNTEFSSGKECWPFELFIEHVYKNLPIPSVSQFQFDIYKFDIEQELENGNPMYYSDYEIEEFVDDIRRLEDMIYESDEAIDFLERKLNSSLASNS
jgi:hypothetical protein